MPSFDVVSEVSLHEVSNAVDQANREVTTRFDFKDTGAEYKLDKEIISLKAQNDFQLKQMLDILTTKLTKRQVDIRSLDISSPQTSLNVATQKITIRQGLDQDNAKKLSKLIKESKLKVQASIQGDKVRISGKQRDDLQQAIAWLRKQEEVKLPLQFNNFRD